MLNGIQWFRGREIKAGTKVKAYFNLHKKLFSIVALDGEHKGKVVAHAPTFSLINTEFKVNQAGRDRVLKEQRKNVHAFVIGYLAGSGDQGVADNIETALQGMSGFGQWVTYNPYKKDHFYYKNSGEQVNKSLVATLVNKKVWVA